MKNNKISDKIILITGGTGFLGRNLATKLSKNNKVVLASRNNYLSQIALKETNSFPI